jgi:hypothetical protein
VARIGGPPRPDFGHLAPVYHEPTARRARHCDGGLQLPEGSAHTRTKYTIPAPSWTHIFWHLERSRLAYPTPEDFLPAITDYLHQEVVRRTLTRLLRHENPFQSGLSREYLIANAEQISHRPGGPDHGLDLPASPRVRAPAGAEILSSPRASAGVQLALGCILPTGSGPTSRPWPGMTRHISRTSIISGCCRPPIGARKPCHGGSPTEPCRPFPRQRIASSI